MGRVLPIVFVFLWALYGVAQYGPGEGGYGAVSLQFSGRLVSAGSCVQEAANLIRCRAPAGTQGTIQLTATVTPGTYPVSIAAVSLPSWARFRPASGYGTAQATCTFLPPPGAARSAFELRFRASTTGAYVDLVVILEVMAPPAEYRTDGQGRFSVPAEELPDTWITGALTRCGDGPLADAPITVRLIPVEGKASIRGLSDVGAVEISSPGYGTATVPHERLRFLSSMDISGHVRRTIDVGTVCLGVGEVPYTVPISPGTVYGETGANGELSISLDPKTRVSGRLRECGGGSPLAGVAVRLTPMYEGEKLVGFEIVPEGYPPKTVTEILRLSLLNVTIYNLGEVCFTTEERGCVCESITIKKPSKGRVNPPKTVTKKTVTITVEGDGGKVRLHGVNVERYELKYELQFEVPLKCCPKPRKEECTTKLEFSPDIELSAVDPEVDLELRTYSVPRFVVAEEKLVIEVSKTFKNWVKISDGKTVEITHECGRLSKTFKFTLRYNVVIERRLSFKEAQQERVWGDSKKIEELKKMLTIKAHFPFTVTCDGWKAPLIVRQFMKKTEVVTDKVDFIYSATLKRENEWKKVETEWKVILMVPHPEEDGKKQVEDAKRRVEIREKEKCK